MANINNNFYFLNTYLTPMEVRNHLREWILNQETEFNKTAWFGKAGYFLLTMKFIAPERKANGRKIPDNNILSNFEKFYIKILPKVVCQNYYKHKDKQPRGIAYVDRPLKTNEIDPTNHIHAIVVTHPHLTSRFIRTMPEMKRIAANMNIQMEDFDVIEITKTPSRAFDYIAKASLKKTLDYPYIMLPAL